MVIIKLVFPEFYHWKYDRIQCNWQHHRLISSISVDGYPVPSNLDGIRDRKNDLTYQDKTPYDEKVANIVSDYYSFTNALMELAKAKGATPAEINAILNTPSKSSHRTGRG